MIKRLLVLTIVFGFFGGGTWYLLKKNPAESVQTLRVKIQKLLNSEDPDDWAAVTTRKERKSYNLIDYKERIDLARKASNRILELQPKSDIDLEARGQLEEDSGNLTAALGWYNKVSFLKRPLTRVEFYRARILKKLGLFSAAQGALSSIIDLYPFEANLELGNLFLETFQGEKAYNSFNKANAYVTTDSELRSILEGRANALQLIHSTNRNQLRQLKSADADNPKANVFETNLSAISKEHRKAIKNAIRLWRRVEPNTKQGFLEIQLKLFGLTTQIDDTENLKFVRESLNEAISNDPDFEDFPIYLLLGDLNLFLAYNSGFPEEVRINYIRNAIKNFQNVFQYKFEEETAEFGYLAAWNLSKTISREDFETELLIRVCKRLLKYPEFWRLLSSEDSEGNKENLEISSRIKVVLNSDEIDPALRQQIEVLKAIGLLKKGELKDFKRQIEILLSSVGKQDKPKFIIDLANQIFLFTPDEVDSLVQLVESELFSKIAAVSPNNDTSFLLVRSAVEILNSARNYLYSQLEMNKDVSPTNHPSEVNRKIDLVTNSIANGVQGISNYISEPVRFLVASNLLKSLVGIDEAIKILQKGLSRHPENVNLKFALGETFVNKAQIDPVGGQSESYYNALKELIPLMESDSYKKDTLALLFSIGARLSREGSLADFDLQPILKNRFPKSSASDLGFIRAVFESFIQRDFEGVISLIPDSEKFTETEPFLNLIIGTCYLQRANFFLDKMRAESPGLATPPQIANYKNRSLEFYNKALQVFENCLVTNSSYFPIQMELAKMRLDSIETGEPVPEELIDDLKEFQNLHPNNSQILYLRALGEKLVLENLVTGETNRKTLQYHITYQRTLLRQAIRENPLYERAYLALAETYVFNWRLSHGPLKKMFNELYAQQFGPPDFDVAISILEGAPRNVSVLSRIAQYREGKGDFEQALRYHKTVFQKQPSDSNIARVVQTYIKIKDYPGAKDWIKSLEISVVSNPYFDIKRNTMLALIDSAEASSPDTSHYDRKLLEASQIKNYKKALEKAQEFGIDPPMGAVNNLAFLLANHGDFEEAKKLIDPLIERLQNSQLVIQPDIKAGVEETYAWVLYKSGNLKKAEEIYRKLCNPGTIIGFHFHFAHVLNELQKYSEALNQLEIVLSSGNLDERHIINKKARKLKRKSWLLFELPRVQPFNFGPTSAIPSTSIFSLPFQNPQN